MCFAKSIAIGKPIIGGTLVKKMGSNMMNPAPSIEPSILPKPPIIIKKST